jgi:hypothetical protein
MDWLDEADGAEAALAETPVEILQNIAQHGSSDQARVAAAKVLIEKHGGDGTVTPWMKLMRGLEELTGAELDEELSGFFNPGEPEPPPRPPAEMTPARVERMIEAKAERRFRSAIKRFLRDRHVAPEVAPARGEETAEPARPKVVRLDSGEILDPSKPLSSVQQDKLNRQQVRNDLRAKRRAHLSPVPTDPPPPGVSQDDWELWGRAMDGF